MGVGSDSSCPSQTVTNVPDQSRRPSEAGSSQPTRDAEPEPEPEPPEPKHFGRSRSRSRSRRNGLLGAGAGAGAVKNGAAPAPKGIQLWQEKKTAAK